MHNSDKIHVSKFSYTPDYDPFFNEDYFQDIELDGKLNHYMDISDLDESGDIFWDEI